ncbi:peroxidasin-like protein [Salmo trutta]|uniref:peroxidasin-like protein n=1 Tax=Salmo trutta TaxID=8032 RepID=UPI001131FEB3|nr:peroxidasin-like protein [Salmo trutta]XP_029604387.1 peroxidasin-like protein [Salmo trutta]
MEHTLLCLLLLLSTHIYSGHSEDDDGKAKAVLTIHPKYSQIFSGESVTLRCNIQRGKVTDWKYTWRKDDVDSISRENEYEISEVKISDNGDYRCLGTHIDQKKHSEWSDAVRLTVTALPETTLTMNPNPAYNGETVTLTCSVGSDSGWRYTWYKDKTKKVVTLSDRHTTTGATFTISRAAESDQGLYWCQGEIQSRSISSIISYPVTITVIVGLDSGWSYTWYKDNTKKVVTLSGRHTTTGDTFTISRAAESDQGLYWCQGEIQSRSISSIISDPVTITVKGSVLSIFLLPRLLCSLLVVSPFLLVSIVLLVKCCRARGLCSTAKSLQYELRSDDVIEQTESSV